MTVETNSPTLPFSCWERSPIKKLSPTESNDVENFFKSCNNVLQRNPLDI